MSYYDRAAKIRAKCIHVGGLSSKAHWNAVSHNIDLMIDSREGDYMIKTNNPELGWPGCDTLYVDFSYGNDGWFSLGSRKSAAWFKREELKEVLAGLGSRFKVSKVCNADRIKKPIEYKRKRYEES